MNNKNFLGFPIAPTNLLNSVDSYEPDFGSVLASYSAFGLPTDLNPPGPSYAHRELPLLADTVVDHLDAVARQLVPDHFQSQLDEFIQYWQADEQLFDPLRPSPAIGEFAGWLRYEHAAGGTGAITQVDYPLEDVITIDTETFVQAADGQNGPVIATAVSTLASYVWIHPALADFDLEYTHQFVPVKPGSVIIAHNASFDIGKLELAAVQSCFIIDTLSMHMVTSGLMSAQRFWFTQSKPNYVPSWASHGCQANLIDCWNFYCGINSFSDLDKSTKDTRNIFVSASSIDEIRNELPKLLEYALNDAVIAANLFAYLYPRFQESCPNSVTLVAQNLIAHSNLPLTPSWHQWLADVDYYWSAELEAIDNELSKLAIEIWQDWKAGEIDIESDPWLSQLDWEANWRVKKNGQPSSKFFSIPQWLKKLLQSVGTWQAGEEIQPHHIKLSTRNQLAPLLLRLTYAGSPVSYSRTQGWTYIDTDSGKQTKIPHPDGTTSNVGSLFSQDFESDFESGLIESAAGGDIATELVKRAISLAYWTSTRKRALERKIVWQTIEVELTEEELAQAVKDGYQVEVI